MVFCRFQLTSSLNVDLWSPDYDFGDINNSLCTLVPTILFFGGLLLIHREVWYSHGVDRNRPDYERLVMDVMFRRDREEVSYLYYVRITMKTTIMSTGPRNGRTPK